jgi:hypothetical protein
VSHDLVVAVAAIVAGAIAAVSGFGVGSLLTPVLAVRYGTRAAVAVVAIPHLVGTVVRLLSLWPRVDRQVLLRFGALSSAGGLIGALLNSRLANSVLTLVFAALLLLAGTVTVAGLGERMRFGRKSAWAAGALSGLFGGLVGNQGGIRAAALLGFDLRKEGFVATATALLKDPGHVLEFRCVLEALTKGGAGKSVLGAADPPGLRLSGRGEECPRNVRPWDHHLEGRLLGRQRLHGPPRPGRPKHGDAAVEVTG